MSHNLINSLYKIKRSCFDCFTLNQISRVPISEEDDLSSIILREVEFLFHLLRIGRHSIIIHDMKVGRLFQGSRSIVYFPFHPWIPE